VNLESGEIVFDHPADEYYREYYLQEKDKLEKSKKCFLLYYFYILLYNFIKLLKKMVVVEVVN
jgi:hypothetical protein